VSRLKRGHQTVFHPQVSEQSLTPNLKHNIGHFTGGLPPQVSHLVLNSFIPLRLCLQLKSLYRIGAAQSRLSCAVKEYKMYHWHQHSFTITWAT